MNFYQQSLEILSTYGKIFIFQRNNEMTPRYPNHQLILFFIFKYRFISSETYGLYKHFAQYSALFFCCCAHLSFTTFHKSKMISPRKSLKRKRI